MIRPAALAIGFGLTLVAGRAANIVAGLGPKPTAASVGVLQLLPERATARDGGFTLLSAPSLHTHGDGADSTGGSSNGQDTEAIGNVGSTPTPPVSSRPATEAVGLLSVGAGDWRQASVDSRATPNRSAESLVNAGECAIAREAFKTGSPDRLLSAIEFVESRGRADAVGDGGRAVGVLQIWPITVADANRILGREEFTLADRLDPDRSRAIFYTITNHYSAGCSDEIKAKRWCNGPRGEHKPGSAAYWAKVQEAMK